MLGWLFGHSDREVESLKQEYVSRFGEPGPDHTLPPGIENDQPGYERLFDQLREANAVPGPDGFGESGRFAPRKRGWFW